MRASAGRWASPADLEKEPRMSVFNTFARLADRLGPVLMLLAAAMLGGATLLAAG